MNNKNTTGQDIAEACGVSQATVSYVLNNKEGKSISPEKRQLILDTAEKLNYFPNTLAKNMRCGKVQSIGVVSGVNLVNIDVNRMLFGVKAFLDTKGYSITLLSNFSEDNNEYIRYYRSNRIAGILFICCELSEELIEKLKNNNIPFITLSERGFSINGARFHDFIFSSLNEFSMMCKQKQYKNIHLFSFNDSFKRKNTKFYLFAESLKNIYPETNVNLFIIPPEKEDIDYIKHIRDYIANNDIDVAVSPNQRLALLIQNAIMSKCLSINQNPKHFSLSASVLYSLIYPSITSIEIPMSDVGSFASEQLIHLINGEDTLNKEFKYKIFYGDSTN